MRIAEDIKLKLSDFKNICVIHKVKYLYAFGSSVTDNFNPVESDIDLVVEIDDLDPLGRGEKLISLWDKFEVFFQRRVDLLTESSIKNPFLKSSIDSTKVLIYDGEGQKVLI